MIDLTELIVAGWMFHHLKNAHSLLRKAFAGVLVVLLVLGVALAVFTYWSARAAEDTVLRGSEGVMVSKRILEPVTVGQVEVRSPFGALAFLPARVPPHVTDVSFRSGDGRTTFHRKVTGVDVVPRESVRVHTVQKEDVARIVSSVKGKVWLLVHDHNGNHVVQKSVTKINEFFHQGRAGEDSVADALLAASLDVVVDEVVGSIRYLSLHPYGCRVVQRLIENCAGEQKERVLDGIVRGGLHAALVDHEYGNYVVQRVLAYGRAEDPAAMFDGVRGNVLALSRQKHSSNVMEMMLTYGDAGQRRKRDGNTAPNARRPEDRPMA